MKEDNFVVGDGGAEVAVLVEGVEHEADFDLHLLVDGRLFDFQARHPALRDGNGVVIDLDGQRKTFRGEDRAVLKGDLFVVGNRLVDGRLKIPKQFRVVGEAHESFEAVAGLVRVHGDFPDVIGHEGQLRAGVRGRAGHRGTARNRFENVSLPKIDHLIVAKNVVDRTIVVALEDNVGGSTGLVEDVPRSHLVAGHRIEGIVEDNGLFWRRMTGILWVWILRTHVRSHSLRTASRTSAEKSDFGGGIKGVQS